ncbi:site-specific DNA-methyltransferase [Paenibacillus sp. FSL H7-0331]|uniref:site-specific DNA-methyltransferase n=1 Tax=Paenibacillus sp. FSL H7-0331 TaxID=1920421 RepID=UPI00096C6367|nr:site-specific DNA-methyltransferase [Paenibacillus sp. FSL H7-0331]OMF14709.1 site-specific DNA-methyltransferase [Paenibacillus sp. FSL H7-0331]
MDKLTMKSQGTDQINTNAIALLFPNVMTEVKGEDGKLRRVIDFDLLKQELSPHIVEGEKERYQLTWPGKKEAILQANQPVEKTLRPIQADSSNWNNTHNMYIEGDNLDVLKLLQESYLNKIKCIYIDPPYNTGNDFIYRDDYSQTVEQYAEASGQVNGEGLRYFHNTESNGRFHSDWLTMIYPRLKLARNLLNEQGVIFISVDDHEVDNLKKVCDELFGEMNFIEQLVWKRRATPPNDRIIGRNHEYIVVYAKNASQVQLYLQPRSEELNARYRNPDHDPRGRWVASDLSANGKGGRLVESCIYPILHPQTGEGFMPPANKCWLYNKEKMDELLADGRIGFRENSGAPYLKRYLSEVRDGVTLPTIIENGGFSFDSAKELKALFDKDTFEFPKPTSLLKILLKTGTIDDDIVLDFFSGSASTADAVMQLNAEDGGNRKYILVQLPEPCADRSEARRAGYETICDIGKERIRRAARKIKVETDAEIDYGFRVYRIDSSNMKEVYYVPEQLEQQFVLELESNIKEDRSNEDLLIQVMLELGLELSLPMVIKEIEGRQVYVVAGNSLVCCFEERITRNVMKEIAKEKPIRAVFRDSSFASDADRIHVEEMFKSLSAGTEIKVI